MNLVMTLCIAYYNTGTECEFLGRYQEAITHFKNGYQLAGKNFGAGDHLTQNLKKCQAQATKKLRLNF